MQRRGDLGEDVHHGHEMLALPLEFGDARGEPAALVDGGGIETHGREAGVGHAVR